VAARAWEEARRYASENTDHLSSHGIRAIVTKTDVDSMNNTIRVTVSAKLDQLFPSIGANTHVTGLGIEHVRADAWTSELGPTKCRRMRQNPFPL